MKSITFLFFCICFFISSFVSVAQQPTGIGIVKPRIVAGSSLYLYSGQLIDDLLHHNTIIDSVSFVQGKYYTDIGSAPPWLVPESLKLDYGLFYLRAVTIARNWIEVVVNSGTGQTAWVDRQDVEYSGWPAFFLEVFSVELIQTIKNPLRIKPLENASTVVDPGRGSLKPIAVRGEWMKVSTIQDNPGSVPKTGWIRWKKGDRILITWSPLC